MLYSGLLRFPSNILQFLIILLYSAEFHISVFTVPYNLIILCRVPHFRVYRASGSALLDSSKYCLSCLIAPIRELMG